ncbi:MAG: PTS sugar transporter subunit IIC [Myxococcales bacterium]|nr:PTS sugar transporter subunit IIC [Myxococcales bacterium]
MMTVLFVGFVGAILLMDRTPMANVMIGRPIVAGPVMGFVVGSPAEGLWVGALFELFWIGAAPIGAFLPPDDTLATCAAVGAYGLSRLDDPAALALVTILAVPLCGVGKALDTRLRRSNIDIVHWVDRRLDQGWPSAVERGHYFSLLGFAAMGSSLVVACTLAELIALKWIYYLLPDHARHGFAVLHVLLPALGIASALTLGPPSRRLAWISFGAFVGLAVAGTVRLL